MALFPSVIPWTLVLTQVMTAGLAVVPGRGAHLFRKCLQVQVLCGWERAGDPEVSVTTSCWVWLSKNKKEKKTSVALVKKLRRKKFTGSGGVPLFFRLTRSHAHVNKHLHGGGGQFQSWWCSRLKGYHADSLQQAHEESEDTKYSLITPLGCL